MKKSILYQITIIFITLGLACAVQATPVLNAANDGFEDYGDGSIFGYYQNSGQLLFVEEGNNEGNAATLAWVESLVENVLGLSESFSLLSTSGIATHNFDINGNEVAGATSSGTWEVTNPTIGLINFYAVKATNHFAMYQVNPAASYGSWSTFDIWEAAGKGSSLEISHFTGYAGLPVPEPGTMILFGVGITCLTVMCRRK